MIRYKGQDDAIEEKRAEVRAASMSQLEMIGQAKYKMISGRLSSGKCYSEDICTLDDPDLIYNLKIRQEKKDRIEFEKECKDYMRERNKYEEGKFLQQRLLTERLVDNPKQQLSNKDLETLIVWKWMAMPKTSRPKMSVLKGKDKTHTRLLKESEWNRMKDREKPCPP